MPFLEEYTLLSKLGENAYATVYKVRHNSLGYIRAVRVLNLPVDNEQSIAYRNFLRECTTLFRLGNGNHPNIVHIYQPRLLEHRALVEMDYVDGTDLAGRLRQCGGFVEADEVVRMALQISSALAYCHEDIYRYCMDREADHLQDDGRRVLVSDEKRRELIQKFKVIHNDIHSGNIMRRENGDFILLDFGLAITGDADVCRSSCHDLEYKAPEKWDNDTLLTEESDIYSFGVVLYEYLTGRVPFPIDKEHAEDLHTLMEQHKSGVVPPILDARRAAFEAAHPGEAYTQDYPDWLAEAIMRCLAKSPADRFHNGRALHDFLAAHAATSPTPDSATTTSTKKSASRSHSTEKQPIRTRPLFKYILGAALSFLLIYGGFYLIYITAPYLGESGIAEHWLTAGIVNAVLSAITLLLLLVQHKRMKPATLSKNPWRTTSFVITLFVFIAFLSLTIINFIVVYG